MKDNQNDIDSMSYYERKKYFAQSELDAYEEQKITATEELEYLESIYEEWFEKYFLKMSIEAQRYIVEIIINNDRIQRIIWDVLTDDIAKSTREISEAEEVISEMKERLSELEELKNISD